MADTRQRAMSTDSSGTFPTGQAIRLACRAGTFSSYTSGLAPGFIQANLIVLPSRYAPDFRLLCHRNPVSCPLLAEAAEPGVYNSLKSCIKDIPDDAIAENIDIRRDFPMYIVYENGNMVRRHISSVENYWHSDHVAFLIGCSYSFEAALAENDLTPPHVVHGRNVSMYRTTIPLTSAGVFATPTCVVSMRMYPEEAIERVREITRPFITTHGEPIAWGWSAVSQLGICDISRPEWGDAPVMSTGEQVKGEQNGSADGSIPVFWGCGVTPQEAVMTARLEGVVLAHAPGHMLVLDIKDSDVMVRD